MGSGDLDQCLEPMNELSQDCSSDRDGKRYRRTVLILQNDGRKDLKHSSSDDYSTFMTSLERVTRAWFPWWRRWRGRSCDWIRPAASACLGVVVRI